MEGIYFQKLGKGRPVLLIHGFCETHEIWNGFADRLAQSFEVYAIDLPGFGKSPSLPYPFTISDIAKMVSKWMVQKKINLPFVVGHSLGGYVALSIANKVQQKISGLCLFHSTPYPDTDERKSNRNKVIEFVKKNGVDPFIDAFVPGLFYNKDHPAMPAVFTMARKTPKDTLLSYTSAMRDRPSSVEILKKITRPVLTIAGDNDSIISQESALEFGHFATNNAIHILKNTGHMGMLEEPETARVILSDFIAAAGLD